MGNISCILNTSAVARVYCVVKIKVFVSKSSRLFGQ